MVNKPHPPVCGFCPAFDCMLCNWWWRSYNLHGKASLPFCLQWHPVPPLPHAMTHKTTVTNHLLRQSMIVNIFSATKATIGLIESSPARQPPEKLLITNFQIDDCNKSQLGFIAAKCTSQNCISSLGRVTPKAANAAVTRSFCFFPFSTSVMCWRDAADPNQWTSWTMWWEWQYAAVNGLLRGLNP